MSVGDVSWSASAGTFTPPGATGDVVTWTAPDTPRLVIITLEVTDDIDDRTISTTVDVGEEFSSLIFGTVEYVDRGYPYIITSNIPVTVSAGSHLTIGPGVKLIVDSGFGGLDVRERRKAGFDVASVGRLHFEVVDGENQRITIRVP